MDIEFFNITDKDKSFAILLKTEANIVLQKYINDKKRFIANKIKFEYVLKVIETIDSIDPNEEIINFILNTLNTLWNIGILSPLTLNADEFISEKSRYGRDNKRYPYIYLNDFNEICNRNAFNVIVKKQYDHQANTEIICPYTVIKGNTRIYINKGGSLTGDYIESCKIRQDIIDRHCFTIQSVVNIPCSYIIDEGEWILTVDHREPKLKALKEFYDVPIKFDQTIKDRKYDIRNYKKLNKQ